MKLFFIRHGESEYGARKTTVGWDNPALSQLGEEQSREAAKNLRDKNIDAIFSSDLKRAHQTALIIRQEIVRNREGVPLMIDWRLREKYYGSKENRPYGELDWAKIDGGDEEYHVLHGIETSKSLLARLESFLTDLTFLPPKPGNILIATSGGILVELARILQPDTTDLRFKNCTIREYDLDELLGRISDGRAR
ncbi:histidine phosphatase family protein [Candidatus Saccharibacteria bacterium]|nr:histidine phosphatase family protein [Candidatus Saccharibacteria bacterium]